MYLYCMKLGSSTSELYCTYSYITKFLSKTKFFIKNTMHLSAKNFLCMILKCNMAKMLVLKNDLRLTTKNCSNVL